MTSPIDASRLPTAYAVDEWLGLRDRRVLVAGAGGLGAAIAGGFAGQGARLFVVDQDEERLAALRASIGEKAFENGGVLGSPLSSSALCRAAVRAATESMGGVDVFVHAVGINQRAPVETFDDDIWSSMLTANLSSALWLGQSVGPLMRDQGWGRLLFLSSVAGLMAHKNHAIYAATKGGLNQLFRVMAHEWADSGVTANALAPGYIETGLTREYLAKDGHREALVKLVPAGRLGVPDDLVGPALFLCSDQAAFVTGQVLYIDGGRTLI